MHLKNRKEGCHIAQGKKPDGGRKKAKKTKEKVSWSRKRQILRKWEGEKSKNIETKEKCSHRKR